MPAPSVKSKHPSVGFLRRAVVFLWAGLILLLGAPGASPQELAGPPAEKTTGWVCGLVVDETFSFVAGAELTLYPQAGASAPPEPVARAASDAHGAFCLQDLPSGFYLLRVAKAPWPIQTPRSVEVRAGLMNRLLPIELELEPGEPRVSYSESFDGMPTGEARATMERLLHQGGAADIQEAARRLLPKGGVRLDLRRVVLGLDVKPLVDELLRQLDSTYLPPLKTARYVYVVGELMDPRNQDAAAQVLLKKLRDGRRLPADPAAAATQPGQTLYVSDFAIQAVARVTGKDFGWKYGQPPLQNNSAIQAAHTWWDQELARRERRR